MGNPLIMIGAFCKNISFLSIPFLRLEKKIAETLNLRHVNTADIFVAFNQLNFN